LSNLLISESGHILTGEQKKGKYNYYSHLSKSGREYFKEENILAWIESEISKIKYTSGFADILKQTFKNLIDEKMDDSSSLLKSLNKKISDLKVKQGKLFALFTEDDLPIDLLKKQINGIEEEIKALKKQSDNIDKITLQTYYEIAEVIEAVRNFPSIYARFNSQEKSEYLRIMVKKIVIKEKAVHIIWKQPFSWIIKTVPSETVLNGSIMLPR